MRKCEDFLKWENPLATKLDWADTQEKTTFVPILGIKAHDVT